MKRYTIAVGFDWKNSDDGMFDDNRHDETRYLMPVEIRKIRDEAFVSKEELDASNTYASREDAERDFAWIKDMYDKWWSDEYICNTPIFPDELSNEFPDHCPEFIFPVGVEEIEVDEKKIKKMMRHIDCMLLNNDVINQIYAIAHEEITKLELTVEERKQRDFQTYINKTCISQFKGITFA